jgi:hypothetical protein
MGRMTWRGRARGPFRALVAGIVAGLLAGAVGWFGIDGLRPRTAMTGRAVAMDGDSLRLDGVELRLEGLDAPELRQTCVAATGEVACGRKAREALAALVPHASFELDHAPPIRHQHPVPAPERPSGLGPIETLDDPSATAAPRVAAAPPLPPRPPSPPPSEAREPSEPDAVPSPEFFDVRALAARLNEPARSASHGGHAERASGDAASAVDAPSPPPGARRPAARPEARIASSAAGAAARIAELLDTPAEVTAPAVHSG